MSHRRDAQPHWGEPRLWGEGDVRLELRVIHTVGDPLLVVSYTVLRHGTGEWLAAVVYPACTHGQLPETLARAVLEGVKSLEAFAEPF